MKRNMIRLTSVLLLMIGFIVPVSASQTEISGASAHTMFVRGGYLFGMGDSTYGAIGPKGTLTTPFIQSTPLETGVTTKAKYVATAYQRTAVLMTDGTAVWFGRSSTTNNAANRVVTPIPDTNITDIALSVFNVYYIKNGNVYQWDLKPTTVPIGIILTGDVVSIAASWYHQIALRSDGTVLTWGRNTKGQLCDGTVVTRDTVIKPVVGLTNVSKIATGMTNSLFLLKDGTLKTCGDGTYGVNGDGTKLMRTTPFQVPNMYMVKQISLGLMQAIVLKTDGTVWAWGFHDYIGGGAYNLSYAPLQIGGLSNMANVASGSDQMIVMDQNGTLFNWAGNAQGKLGDGTNVERHSPVVVSYIMPRVVITTPTTTCPNTKSQNTTASLLSGTSYKPTTDDCNNGHGNDDDHDDSSNPGSSKK